MKKIIACLIIIIGFGVFINQQVEAKTIEYNFQATIDDKNDAGGQIQGITSGDYPWNFEISLTANLENGEGRFLYWTNNGVLVSKNINYTFRIQENTIIKAYFIPNNMCSVTYIDQNMKVLYQKNIVDGESILQSDIPNPSKKAGYSFSGWDALPEYVNNGDLYIKPVYEKASNIYDVKVVLDNENEITYEVSYGELLTITSTNQDFISWEIDGKIISFERTLKLHVYNHLTITANNSGENTNIVLTHLTSGLATLDTITVTAFVENNGADVIEAGIFYSTIGIPIENVNTNRKVAQRISDTNEFAIIFPNTNPIYYVQPYAITSSRVLIVGDCLEIDATYLDTDKLTVDHLIKEVNDLGEISSITYSNAEKINSLKSVYDNLKSIVVSHVPEEIVNKLQAAVDRITALTPYTITYHDNFYQVKKDTWATKSAFVNEIYNDIYQWLSTRVGKINNLTYTNGTYSYTRNGTTVSWKSYQELLAISIANFELTIGNLMYKPFVRNDGSLVIMETDNNYFFNSESYQLKYLDMDQYFQNSITIRYTTYNRGYNPTSLGKVQIFYRFHQWANGSSSIPSLDNYPDKYVPTTATEQNIIIPTPLNYNSTTETFKLPVMTNNDYVFLGWYENSDCTGAQITSIEKGTTGNVDLYAKWLFKDTARFTVIFKNNDNVLKTEVVKYGDSATAPIIETNEEGYKYSWDRSFEEVTTNLVVTNVKVPIEYNIIYNDNLSNWIKVDWANKSAFTTEFYQNFFDWLSDNVDNIPELTYSNQTYEMTKNSKTATWKNPTELMAVNISIFQATLGHFIYKPFTRVGTTAIIPTLDENYFLNSSEYRLKYQDLDRYFLAASVSYNYDTGYNANTSNNVQVFYRFQQWAQGKSITCLDTIPSKYTLESATDAGIILPTTNLTYNIESNFMLPVGASSKYDFIGWFLNKEGTGNKVTSITPGKTGQLELFAKWDFDNTKYEIKFLNSDKTLISAVNISPGEVVVAPTNYTLPNGYEFDHWDKDFSEVSEDMVVMAVLKTINYSISYDLVNDLAKFDDGCTPLISYTIESDYTLPVPSCVGYVFMGWYTNSSYTGNAITVTSFGNLTLFAKWENMVPSGTLTAVSSDETIKVGLSTRVYVKNTSTGVYQNSTTLRYASMSPNIATVDETGFVVGVSVGTARIYIYNDTDCAYFDIVVNNNAYAVKWVGHQGSSGPFVQNTIDAFNEGGRRGYYALECDNRVSKDGKYYICHDDTFLDSLFVDTSLSGIAMAGYNWDQLKVLQIKDTYNGVIYYSYLSLISDYLDSCKTYGSKALIELKWTTGVNSNDMSKFSGLMDLVKAKGMYENTIFMTSMKNSLTHIRTNYPDANIQFLSGASTTTDANIDWCIENKFSLDASSAQVTKAIVDKMHDAHLYVNAYTVDSTSTSSTLQGYGVDMITTNSLGQ